MSFICLNKLLLLKQKLQACWTILLKFGYDIDLSLSNKYIKEKYGDFSRDGMLELSQEGVNFLIKLWRFYEESEVADIHILEEIFSTIEGGCPFLATEVTIINNNKITLKTWIDIWQMLIHKDYQKAFEYALYLGYDGNAQDFVKVTKTINWWMFNKKGKALYRCILVQNKHTLLNKLIKTIRKHDSNRSAVITLPQNETLIMTEISEDFIKKASDTKSNARNKELHEYDMCLFIHDGSMESAEYIKLNYKRLPKKLSKALLDLSEGRNSEIYSSLEKVLREIKNKMIFTATRIMNTQNIESEKLRSILIDYIYKLLKKS